MSVAITANVIDDDVLAVLSDMECEGDLAKQYTKTLDRALYVRLNKVLEALGGKWNRGRKGHVFKSGDASASIAAVVQFGEYADPRVVFQDFPTPPELAAELVEIAMYDHAPRSLILEPSCGNGNIVQAMIKYGCENIHAIDVRQECCDRVKGLGKVNKVTCGDFMTMKPKPTYRAIVMNPPFRNGQDIEHVRHAYDFLLVGGVLVAIMSPGFTFVSNRRATNFRSWAKEMNGNWRENPSGSFADSGTNVNTITFTVTKV